MEGIIDVLSAESEITIEVDYNGNIRCKGDVETFANIVEERQCVMVKEKSGLNKNGNKKGDVMGGRGGNSGLSSQSTQEKLFEREQEISARKKELNDILRDSDEWSIRHPSPEIAAEQKKLNEELEQIKAKRRNLPNLTFYVANTETGKVDKFTVDNKGEYHYSAEIRAIAKAIGKSDDIALDYSQNGKIRSFESKKQAESYIKIRNQKFTEKDEEKWRKKVRRAQKMITYDDI